MSTQLICKLAQLVEEIPAEKNVAPPSPYGTEYVPDYFWMGGTSACLIPWCRHLLGEDEANDFCYLVGRANHYWLFDSDWAEVAGTPKDAAHRLYYVAAYGNKTERIKNFDWSAFIAEYPFEDCKRKALELCPAI